MIRRVIFTPEAKRQLASLYDYIARATSDAVARGYIARIERVCSGLADFPLQGRQRDDLRPGVRKLGFEQRADILFAVTDESVEIIGVFYGGQDYETRFADLS